MISSSQYQRQQKFTLQTEGMVPGGGAIGHLPDGRPVFIKDAAPNETLEISLRRIKKDFAEGTIDQILSSSPNRVTPVFPVAALAGANWAHLHYETQLTAKEKILRDLLQRIGHLNTDTWKVSEGRCPIVGAPEGSRWRYRNKVELTFGVDEADRVALGFHVPGRFDRILPTDDIALFPEVGREIIQAVTGWANGQNLTVFDPRCRQGLLRNLVIRRAEHGDDVLINLVTMPAKALPLSELLGRLDAINLSGVVWTENAALATIVRADATHLLEGLDFIDETFLGVKIRCHADAFFQTHTTMAEKLAETLLGRLESLKPKQVIDGYAGVGGFGLFAALQGLSVVSIESHPASSADAQANATRLGVADRMTFINELMETYLLSQDSKFKIPNSVLIVDPPRAGLHPKALQAILDSDIQRVFYVSCNPATLARDLSLFTSHSLPFTPILIQPFDLFPQTSHVETLVELVRGSLPRAD